MKTDLLGTDEVAAELNKSRQFVQGEIRKKKLRAVKVGREFKVSRKDLNLYMGVDNSTLELKQEIYIKELEAKVKHLEFVLDAVRSNLHNLSDVVEKIEQYDEQEEFEEAMEYEDYLREVDEINSDGVHVVVNRDDIVSDEELEEMIQAEKNNEISDCESDIHNFSVCVDGENIIFDTIHYWDSSIGNSYFDLIKNNEFDTPGPFLYPDYSLEFVKISEGIAYYNLVHNYEPKVSDIHNFSVQLYDNEILCDEIRYWESAIGTGYIEFVKYGAVIDTFMVCNYNLRFITILGNTAYYNLVYKGA